MQLGLVVIAGCRFGALDRFERVAVKPGDATGMGAGTTTALSAFDYLIPHSAR